MLTYLWWASPQFTYYLIPLAVLMGALVTIGALTKNTELVVMKACGISLYRAAAPLLILALIGSAILLGLEERVLAVSNRRADAINDAIRGRLPTTTDLNRRWVAANNGNIYQYLYFDPGRNRLNGLSIYEFGKDPSTLARRKYFAYATFNGDREAKGQVTWQGGKGWEREFEPKRRFASFTQPVRRDGRPGLFRRRAARRGVHVLPAAQRARRRRSRPAASTWCRTSSRCTGSSRFRSSRSSWR